MTSIPNSEIRLAEKSKPVSYLDLLVVGSFITITSAMSPNLAKYSLRPSEKLKWFEIHIELRNDSILYTTWLIKDDQLPISKFTALSILRNFWKAPSQVMKNNTAACFFKDNVMARCNCCLPASTPCFCKWSCCSGNSHGLNSLLT